MSSDPNPAPKGTRLWLRIVLVVSLGLNLLVAGAIAGIVIKGGPMQHAGPPSKIANETIGPFTRALSPRDRISILRQVHQQGEFEGWSRATHRQAMEEMIALLETTPFDADAFADKFGSMVTGLQTRLDLASGAFVIRLQAMSDEDRIAYAARVRDAMEKKGR
ncbi:MAG: periplasmic heavy metal sensor [Pseudomonadota bacterium]